MSNFSFQSPDFPFDVGWYVETSILIVGLRCHVEKFEPRISIKKYILVSMISKRNRNFPISQFSQGEPYLHD